MSDAGWRTDHILRECYINDAELLNSCCSLLVTYETLTGKRYVKQVLCEHGYVCKKIGKIVAWMRIPKPYKGK